MIHPRAVLFVLLATAACDGSKKAAPAAQDERAAAEQAAIAKADADTRAAEAQASAR